MQSFFRPTVLAALYVAFAPAFCSAQPGVPDPSKPGPSLAMVPPDAAAFLHCRFAELWDSPFGKQVIAAIAKDAPNWDGEIQKRTGLTLSNVATATYIFGRFEAEESLFLITTRKPFDKTRLLTATVPNVPAESIGGLTIYSQSPRAQLVIVDDRCFGLASGHTSQNAAAFVKKMQAAIGKSDPGPLRAALDRDAGKAVLVGGLNVQAIPPIPAGAQVLGVVQDLLPLLKAKTASGVITLGDHLQIDATIDFAGGDDVGKGEAALEAGRKALLGMLDDNINAPIPPSPERDLVLIILKEIRKTVQNGEIARGKDNLRIKLVNTDLVTNGPKIASMAAAAVRKTRYSAARMVAMSSLKQMGLAMHMYHDATKSLPTHAIYAKDGKTPLLSWRVAILPYIEQDELYKQFKLDEPWDSEHNEALIAKMPRIYQSPIAPPTKEVGKTHYRVFVGNGALFDLAPKATRFADVRDGLSNTIMIVDSEESVPWTKPDDIVFDPAKPLPKLGSEPGSDSFLATLGDGSVRSFKKLLAEKTLKALITRSGGEITDPKELDK